MLWSQGSDLVQELRFLRDPCLNALKGQEKF